MARRIRPRPASGAWRKLRTATLEAQRYRCADCGSFGGISKPTLELHHLHYRTLGHETAVDVVALCKVCHSNADMERAKRGSATAAAALWDARLAAAAATLDYEPPDVEEAFASWLAGRDES